MGVKVAKRRRLLDALSWKRLDSYLDIREKLGIRHRYRMEALIGKLPEYKYTERDMPKSPGFKTLMRIKKYRRLFENRVAKAIKQGKPKREIQRLRSKVNQRRWATDVTSEIKFMVKGKEIPT